MLEKYLIEACSPTLASLKSASLFAYRYTDLAQLKAYIQDWNLRFQAKHICLRLLKASNGFALIYVYRPGMLAEELRRTGVPEFLKCYGYTGASEESALSHLTERITDCDVFPHEIGLFLGYPLGDVRGFIENAGEHALCSGCWKVYCNKCEAVKTFARFRKCREIYTRLWSSGARSLGQLTVAS